MFFLFFGFSRSFQFNLLFVLSCDIPLLFLTGCFSYAHNFASFYIMKCFHILLLSSLHDFTLYRHSSLVGMYSICTTIFCVNMH